MNKAIVIENPAKTVLLALGLMLFAGCPFQTNALDEVVAHVVRPDKGKLTEEQMKSLKLPPGFQINVFAKDLGNARMMVVTEDGSVLVTRMAQGKVTLLQDKNGDGVAEIQKDIVPDLDDVHGIALRPGQIFLATTRQLHRGAFTGDGVVRNLEKIGEKLPDGGQHGRRTIGFGDDGLLYISIGSSCNNCEETNPEHATILRCKPDGSDRVVFAKGLRNTLGFAWHPKTRELWGMDHGSDDRGDDLPPEELNRIVQDADYGWPFCYGDNVVDARANDPKKGTKEERCVKSIPPVLSYQAHSAPIGMAFYTESQFPAEYRNDAFVAMRGSWNRKPATGYKVVRIRFQNGKPVAFEDFVSGFLSADGKTHFGRLAGVAVAKDGSLLFSDDTNGVIYRVAHGNTPTRNR
jgi:glucose/arabinose dehydrogenase